MFNISSPLPRRRRISHRRSEARDRLLKAREDLHPESDWRGAVLTAVRAVQDPSPARIRALYWMHDALTAPLPDDPASDSVEQRVLRRAAGAIEDELVAEHVSALRIA